MNEARTFEGEQICLMGNLNEFDSGEVEHKTSPDLTKFYQY